MLLSLNMNNLAEFTPATLSHGRLQGDRGIYHSRRGGTGQKAVVLTNIQPTYITVGTL